MPQSHLFLLPYWLSEVFIDFMTVSLLFGLMQSRTLETLFLLLLWANQMTAQSQFMHTSIGSVALELS